MQGKIRHENNTSMYVQYSPN
uniref:Uncharacterized protein n=1 Tax=Arundo donax TaxID=35708 RepID=A0A0A9ATQ1_ARUDO